MFRFAHSEYLYALYLIPLFAVLYWYTQKKQTSLLRRFANPVLHDVLFPLHSRIKGSLKFGLTMFAAALLIVALANPQIGSKIEEVKQVGIDVYIILDVSVSMTAEDIKPSRLEKAKHEISQLIQKLKGDRIGMIVFAGQPFVQFPLTSDYAAANLLLSAVSTSSVPTPGTAIGPALELAIKSFKKDDDMKKVIVLITDGEDHEGEIDPALEDAASKGIIIYTIGLGSPAGVPIPIANASGTQTGFFKDNDGNIVLTKLDETTLQMIAEKGNGKYYRGSNTQDELDEIYKDLTKVQGSEYGSKQITEYEDRFYYFLFPAILLLVFEFLIPSNKSKLLMRFENMRNKV